jgi:hypothetical protein
MERVHPYDTSPCVGFHLFSYGRPKEVPLQVQQCFWTLTCPLLDEKCFSSIRIRQNGLVGKHH